MNLSNQLDLLKLLLYLISVGSVLIYTTCATIIENDKNNTSTGSDHEPEQQPQHQQQHEHLYNSSEYIIKILGNQGLIFTPLDLPYFAHHYISFNINISLDHDNNILFTSSFIKLMMIKEAEIMSELNLNLIKYSFAQIAADCNQNRLSIYLSEAIKIYFEEFNKYLIAHQNVSISFPLEKLERNLFLKNPEIPGLLDKCKHVNSNTNNNGSMIRLRFKVPVHSPQDKFLQVKAIKFKSIGQGLCYASSKYSPDDLILVRNGQLYQTTIRPHNSHILPQIQCRKSTLGFIEDTICWLTKESEEYFANYIPDPCLNAIWTDASVQVINEVCSMFCDGRTQTPGIQNARGPMVLTKPEVIEVGDTLYISNAISRLKLACTFNSTMYHELFITPPPYGALQLKMFCGCELYYTQHHPHIDIPPQLLWSRKISNPPSCALLNLTANNEQFNGTMSTMFELYQLLPSQAQLLQVEPHLINLNRSRLETKIFYNISNSILSKDALDEFIMKELLVNGVDDDDDMFRLVWLLWDYWKLLCTILVFCGIFAYYRHPSLFQQAQVAAAVAPQQQQGVAFFNRRKG